MEAVRTNRAYELSDMILVESAICKIIILYCTPRGFISVTPRSVRIHDGVKAEDASSALYDAVLAMWLIIDGAEYSLLGGQECPGTMVNNYYVHTM